jgi:hypothetical protein
VAGPREGQKVAVDRHLVGQDPAKLVPACSCHVKHLADLQGNLSVATRSNSDARTPSVPGNKGIPCRARSGFRKATRVNFWAEDTIGDSRGADCPLTPSRRYVTVSAPRVVKTNLRIVVSAGRRFRSSWPAGCGVYLKEDVRLNTMRTVIASFLFAVLMLVVASVSWGQTVDTATWETATWETVAPGKIW